MQLTRLILALLLLLHLPCAALWSYFLGESATKTDQQTAATSAVKVNDPIPPKSPPTPSLPQIDPAIITQLTDAITTAQQKNTPHIININIPMANSNANNKGVNANNGVSVNASAQSYNSTNIRSTLYAHLATLQKKTCTTLLLNKWLIAKACGIASYSALCVSAIRGNFYLAEPTLWSSWRQKNSFEQLLAMPQQELAKELLHEIQHRYTEPEAIADFFEPLVHFMNTVSQELAHLHYYKKLHALTNIPYAYWLIPINRTRYAEIPTKIQRLLFIKNVFLHWAAEYKIIHNNAFRRFKKAGLIDSNHIDMTLEPYIT